MIDAARPRRPKRLAGSAAAALVLEFALGSGPLLARTVPSTLPAPDYSQEEIVVTGRRGTSERGRNARAVTKVLRVSPSGVVARWSPHDRICVSVHGGAPAQADYIEGAIIDAAGDLRLRLGRPGACDGAIQILLTDSSDLLIDELRRRHIPDFRDLGASNWLSLKNSKHAIRWVSSSQDRGPKANRHHHRKRLPEGERGSSSPGPQGS